MYQEVKHSQKPIEVLEAIQRMFPTQDRIELFARHKPENWDVWGLDVLERNTRIKINIKPLTN